MSKLDFGTQNYIQDGVSVNQSLLEREKQKRKDNLFFLIISFFALVLMLTVVILNTYVFFIADVSGSSMFPTLQNGDKLITNRYKEPKVDSIIIIRYHRPNGTSELWIKRAIAVEGDTVEIKDGFVYVNGLLKDEPYIAQGIKTQSIKDGKDYGFESVKWTLKKDEVFFLGDNRYPGMSKDSRVVGPYKTSEIMGVVEEWSLRFNEKFK